METEVIKAAWGGRRPGAGRPKGSKAQRHYAAPSQAFADLVSRVRAIEVELEAIRAAGARGESQELGEWATR